MGVTTTKLSALQDLDLERDRLEGRIVAIEEEIKEPQELLDLRGDAIEAEAEIANVDPERIDLELRSGEIEGKISKEQDRLYGGTVKSPRELQDIEAEVKNLKMQLDDLELRELEVLEQLDGLQKRLADGQNKIKRAERDWVKLARERLSEKESATVKIEALSQEIEPARAVVKAEPLRLYDRLRTQKQGRAVAKLAGMLCEGCGIGVSEADSKQARAGDAIVQCRSCRRILLVTPK